MVEAILLILAFQLIGEVLHEALPLPGPVIGMILLTAWLIWRRRRGSHEPAAVGAAARALISSLGLLFVPAGVGIVVLYPLLVPEWGPILVGLAGSTLLGLLVTGWVMHAIEAHRAGS